MLTADETCAKLRIDKSRLAYLRRYVAEDEQ